METKHYGKVDFRHIIFLQGDDANLALDVLDVFGETKTIEMLLKYDTCDLGCRRTEQSPSGESDTVHWQRLNNKAYELAYNMKLGTIGLCEIIQV